VKGTDDALGGKTKKTTVRCNGGGGGKVKEILKRCDIIKKKRKGNDPEKNANVLSPRRQKGKAFGVVR